MSEGPAVGSNWEEKDKADIERLKLRGWFVRKNPNRYDRKDMIQRLSVLYAGSLKFAAYRVRDPETDVWGPVQFHLMYDNHVLAVMGQESAKLFCTMYEKTMSGLKGEGDDGTGTGTLPV